MIKFRENAMRLSMLLASAMLVATATDEARAQLDCTAEFNDAISMIDDEREMETSSRVEMLQMALEAHEMCEAGRMEEAQDLFDQVFNRRGGN